MIKYNSKFCDKTDDNTILTFIYYLFLKQTLHYYFFLDNNEIALRLFKIRNYNRLIPTTGK